jgi:hypothetical protein
MLEFSLDLLKAGLNGDYAKLKLMIQQLDPYEEFIAKMCKKYGPSTTILPLYLWTIAHGISCHEVYNGHAWAKGGRMRLPLLDLKEEDKKELEKLKLKKIK